MSNGDFTFACDKCPRTFKLEEFYEKHKKVHELKKQHKCDICGFVYGAAKGLEGHIKTHSDEEIAAAHQATKQKITGSSPGFGVDFRFLNPQGVLAQAKLPVSPKKDEPVTAQVTPHVTPQVTPQAEIISREQLNGKAPSPAGTGNYIIYEQVPEVNDASAAVQNDSGFFMCSICKREFSGLNSLKKHIPIHTRKIQHKCDVCGYVFGKKEYLLDHMRKHTGEVSPICEVCGQTFNKSLKLKEHFKLHRNTGPNSSMSPYKCHVCNAVFARPDVLGNHLTVAHAETVYKCDICEATFGDVRGKNHHMYNEHQLDAFHQKCVWCPVCNQGFTRHYNLKVHMYKSHGKEYIENNFSPAELAALMKSAPSPPGAAAAPNIPTVVNMKAGPLSSKQPLQPLPPLDFNKRKRKLDEPKALLSQHELTNLLHGGRKLQGGAVLTASKKPRRPGPASKTNAPPEKRGSNSIPTYLQLTQVSRRSSMASNVDSKEKINPPEQPNNPMADIIQKLVSATASKVTRPDERPSCNFCTKICSSQVELSQHLVNDHFKGLLVPMGGLLGTPQPKAEPQISDAQAKAIQKQKQIRRTLGLEPEPVFRKPGPKRARLNLSYDSYDTNTEDVHQKETDELRPSLLAARSDAQAAAKEAQEKAKLEEEQAKVDTDIKDEPMEAMNNAGMTPNAGQLEQEDVRYEPITEDFLFEDTVINPCYVVLPFVTDEEVEAAGNATTEEVEENHEQDYADEEAPLTIDESIVDDEPDLPKSPIKSSELIPEEILRPKTVYNAEDINGHLKEGGFYPAMADYSLPFSMANIWKKKADGLGNFNAMEHLALMEKIEQMQKYNGSVVGSGAPSPPPIPLPPLVSHHVDSPKKPKTKPQSPPGQNTPKEKKFIATGNVNQTPVADYENQIKNDIWPLDCIKCNSLLGNLDNFNLHMNDHWSDDKCCPVCGLLINSKRFNFKQHLKIHTGEKPFTCNICNRSFRQKAHMVKHVTTHRTLPNGTPPNAILALEAK